MDIYLIKKLGNKQYAKLFIDLMYLELKYDIESEDIINMLNMEIEDGL